jgi:hypothetical protein
MANKRILKKSLNELVYDVVDECYFIQATDATKIDATENLINEAATFQDTTIRRIKTARGKAEFRAIVTDVEEKADHFVDALNGLNG